MQQADKDKPATLSDNLFPVVGVGASAGGLEAFKHLIKAIPENSGIAYILVQHLDPFHESVLSDILQRSTSIPVLEITDNITVEPDHIYIIPANKILIATDGVLKLDARPPKPEKNMPINIFFNSLAEVHQAHAIGVVLSGTGTDGTIGLEAIKGHGGICLAQDPGSAAYDGMPLSAIQSDNVDYVLPPAAIPGKIIELARLVTKPDDPEGTLQKEKENVFKKILSLMRLRSSVDFAYYKQSIVQRQILRQMVQLKIKGLQEYLLLLEASQQEQEILYQHLLIPGTSFFRDGQVFDYLCETVFPELVKDKSNTEPVRIWVAACSTGEEAYSMAICLNEYLSGMGSDIKIQLFATDVSEKAIAKARSGRYLKSELENVSAERLNHYFDETNGHYQVKKPLRDMCVFAVHNFLKDPPFARMDLVSCRNALMNMQPYLQKKALATFHYALNGNAFLLLGKLENSGNAPELFAIVNAVNKLYTRKDALRKFVDAGAQPEIIPVQTDKKPGKNRAEKEDFQKIADDILLSVYTPPGVVVNGQFDIVQFRGATAPYLENPAGRPSLNVIKMAREGLAFELRNLLLQAKLAKVAVSKENIPVEKGNRLVTIEVVPILNTIELYLLVLFKNTVDTNRMSYRADAVKGNESTRGNLRIQQLETELAHSRDEMQRIAENHDAATEELQSANEELLSGSEELQSVNEELETSKEQIQNNVEELIIVNRELYERNEQYNNERLYSKAIIKTIRQPLMVLTKELKVQRVNSAFYKTFKVAPFETEGKLLFELGGRQWDIPDLRSKLNSILDDKGFEDFEVTQYFRGIGEKTMLLNASRMIKEDSSELLILLAMEDITVRKALDKKEQEFASERIAVLEAIPQCAWTAAANGDITYVNKFFYDYTGMTEAETLKTGWAKAVEPKQVVDTLSKYVAFIHKGRDFDLEFLMKRKRDDGYRWHLLRALATRDQTGAIISWVGTLTDINDETLFAEVLEQQVAERTKSLKILNAELEQSNKNLEQFAYIASHDLQEPLRKIQIFSSMLADDFTDLPQQAKEIIRKINSSSQRMTVLIKDVLNFSKLTLSEFTFSPTSLDEVLANTLGEFDLMIEEKKAVIHSSGLPVVEAIPLQMKQLFYNLVSNALKFSAAGRAPVLNISSKMLSAAEVKKHPKLQAGLLYCELVFKDNGIGFDQQFAEKIFLIFQRLHSRQLYAGTGIGLALCQNIAINHSGSIYAEATEHEGAVFHILLPVKQLKSTIKL